MAPPTVDLTDLQRVVGEYLGEHGLVVAAGPFTAAAAARIFLGKSKLVSTAMTAGGAWLAVQAISQPMLKLMQDQFGYLQSLLGG
ncbi:MAG: hypothetical protein M3N93_00590 [Acidobacteriota bacterium]|nr:hypothetical protein [Acidobacteriota bacterium]